MKIKIAETAQRYGVKSAYALQKALNISPTIASRLWKGEFDKIGINTLERLCAYFQCQPNDFLEYPLTLSGNTQSSKDVERATQLSNTQLSNDTQTGNTQSSNTDTQSSNTELRNESDNDRLLSTVEVAERLSVSRKSVNDYILDGKLPAVKGKQNHNFVKLSDVLIYESVHGAKV